jgi:hypothetical protein
MRSICDDYIRIGTWLFYLLLYEIKYSSKLKSG